MARVKISKTTLKAFAILEKLNVLGETRNSVIADTLGLPRATCYRLLETLCAAGLASHDANTHLYRPTERVLALSCGFEQETWIAECAKPHMSELGADLLWPIAIATLSGPSMLLRETTDPDSPLVVRRYLPGRRVGLLSTATGRVYLAHCGTEQRDTLIDILQKSDKEEDLSARNRARVEERLRQVREFGFDSNQRQSETTTWRAMAVPVFAHQRILASLSVRYIQKAVSRAKEREEFLPKLRHTARQIGQSFEAASTGD